MSAKKKILFLSIVLTILIGAFFFCGEKEGHKTQIEGNKDDLISFSILPNQKVSGLEKIVGSVKNNYFFEGNILINILDVNKNLIKTGYATATTDWMTSGAVSFVGEIDFANLPKGPAYVEIRNDNPSDLSQNDKNILIPIVIK